MYARNFDFRKSDVIKNYLGCHFISLIDILESLQINLNLLKGYYDKRERA